MSTVHRLFMPPGKGAKANKQCCDPSCLLMSVMQKRVTQSHMTTWHGDMHKIVCWGHPVYHKQQIKTNTSVTKYSLRTATKLHVFEYGGTPCGLLDHASHVAAEWCMKQWTEGKQEKPIPFASCELTPTQSAMSTTENKKAVLSQRWPCDAPYIWVPWKFLNVHRKFEMHR